MADDALSDLVDAFGHVSEAEIQAFLDKAPAAPALAASPRSDAPVAFGNLAAIGIPSRISAQPDQAARA